MNRDTALIIRCLGRRSMRTGGINGIGTGDPENRQTQAADTVILLTPYKKLGNNQEINKKKERLE